MWEAFPNVYLAFFVLFKGDTVDLTVGAFSSKKREATAIGRQLVNPFCIRSWGGRISEGRRVFRRYGHYFSYRPRETFKYNESKFRKINARMLSK